MEIENLSGTKAFPKVNQPQLFKLGMEPHVGPYKENKRITPHRR